MANIIQRRRGTTAHHSTFTGAEGEITIDLDKDTVVVHDNVTLGGFPLAREDLSNALNRVGIAQLNLNEGTPGQVLQTDGFGIISFTNQPDISAATVGGDISGTVGNAQIVADSIGINELNLQEGTIGQILTTNGAGVISFESSADISLSSVGGDVNGTVGNIQINAGAVDQAELATDSVRTIHILDANVTLDKLATDSVETIKIKDSNVTNDKILSMNADKLTGTLPQIDGFRVLNIDPTSHTHAAKPYDISFIAGYDIEMLPVDIVAQKYGEMVMARTGTFEGEQAYVSGAPTGSDLTFDILKNGNTIYSTKPKFAAGSNANNFTVGVLSITSFVAGDRISFTVTQIGSSAAGTGLSFMMKCKV
jgi:hypothetical protein